MKPSNVETETISAEMIDTMPPITRDGDDKTSSKVSNSFGIICYAGLITQFEFEVYKAHLIHLLNCAIYCLWKKRKKSSQTQ